MGIPADQIVPIAQLLGLGFLGIVAAFGLWWGRRQPTPAEKTLEVAGALVDNKAVMALAAALEAHTLELMTCRVENAKEAEKARALGHRLVDVLAKIGDEIGELRRSADTLAREVSRK